MVTLINNQTALEIFQAIGDRTNEAYAFFNLAKLHHDLIGNNTALQYCQQALSITSDLDIPLKDDCKELLRELNGDD
jgi:hypothetical protein